MRRQFKSALFAGVVLVSAGCKKETAPPNGVYDITGTVVSTDSAAKTVELDHEEIPGVMAAMDMAYSVADPKILAGVKAGDSVRGKLNAESGNYTITSLSKR